MADDVTGKIEVDEQRLCFQSTDKEQCDNDVMERKTEIPIQESHEIPGYNPMEDNINKENPINSSSESQSLEGNTENSDNTNNQSQTVEDNINTKNLSNTNIESQSMEGGINTEKQNPNSVPHIVDSNQSKNSDNCYTELDGSDTVKEKANTDKIMSGDFEIEDHSLSQEKSCISNTVSNIFLCEDEKDILSKTSSEKLTSEEDKTESRFYPTDKVTNSNESFGPEDHNGGAFNTLCSNTDINDQKDDTNHMANVEISSKSSKEQNLECQMDVDAKQIENLDSAYQTADNISTEEKSMSEIATVIKIRDTNDINLTGKHYDENSQSLYDSDKTSSEEIETASKAEQSEDTVKTIDGTLMEVEEKNLDQNPVSSEKNDQSDSSEDEDSKQNDDMKELLKRSVYDSLLLSEDSSSAFMPENKVNGMEGDITQELISESSCSEYPPSLDTPGPPTPMSSIVESGPTPVKRSRLGSTSSSVQDTPSYKHPVFPASKLFEYQWPQDHGPGGEWFFLQEQLSEFLDVKSFRRKFPELTRRPVDMKEREFLRDKLVVTETQCDLGLTAVRSEEVLDMMARDYPEKYRQYTEIIHEREKQKKIEKHKEYGVPKLEKDKMKLYIQKAMKSASEWNAGFIKDRKEERRAYFDQQTFNIHFPASKFKKLSAEETKIGAYPVALLPGQFQESFKPYSADELKYFPLNTVLFDPPKTMNHMLSSPTSQETASEEDGEGKSGTGSDSDDDSSSSSEGSSEAEPEPNKDKQEDALNETICRVCDKEEEEESGTKELVQCSECARHGHPACLDLTDDMVSVIKTYPWQCMECKTCVECMDPFDEDKMMFCDKCDRGYHTFCVGLKSIPNGPWKCQSCKGPETPKTPKSASKRGRGRGRGRPRGSGRGPGRPPRSLNNSFKSVESILPGSEPSTAESSPFPVESQET